MSRRRPSVSASPASRPHSHEPGDGLLGLSGPEAVRLGERLRRLALGLTAALVAARFLSPGEDADEGTGLPWVLLTLATLGLSAFSGFVGGALRMRFSRVDVAVLGLILVVALSGYSALDHRAAITMTWEWVGLGAVYLLVRNLPQGADESRALAGVLVAVAVAAAAAGLYQVLVEDPVTRLQYLADPDAALRMAGVDPGSPTSRAMFEARLLGSREPRSPYALANSLAGVLVGPLVVGLALLLESILRREDRQAKGRLMVALMAASPLLVVLTCLMLTKSRSAWVGLGVGLLVIGWRLRGEVRRGRLIAAAAGLAVVLGGLAIAGLATGQLDRQVLTESTKSLGFRAEYWAGTWGLITESWRNTLAGVGPGNFAGPYLRHKLPTSSEEISDPHNFLLEIWATSGAFALIALVAALGLGLREAFGPSRSETRHPGDSSTVLGPEVGVEGGRTGWLWLAAGGGWLLVVGLGRLNPFLDDGRARWLVLGAAGAWAAALIGPLWRRRGVPAWALGAGALAVMVNLLAAGGLTFPPVALALWLPIALGQNLREDRAGGRLRGVGGRWASFGLMFAAAAVVGLFVGNVVFHALPARAALDEGRAALAGMRPDFNRATGAFARSARLDRYANEPWVALADLAFRQWVAEGMPVDAPDTPPRQRFDIRARLAAAFDGATRPPRNPDALAIPRFRMELTRRVLELRGPEFPPEVERGLQADLAAAAAQAVRLYPTSAGLRAEYAQSAAAVGLDETAALQAREALRLDSVTPHKDKKLAGPVRDRLRAQLPRWSGEE